MPVSFARSAVRLLLLTPLLISITQSDGAAADYRVRAAQQALITAQTKFGTAQRAWNHAQEDFTRAQTQFQNATNRVHQMRQAAAQRLAAELGMTAAVSEREAASRHIEARRTAIEAGLRTHSDYQTAEKQTEAARKRLLDLSQDKSLTEEQQQKLASELAARIRHPTEMRKEAEARDADMQKATQSWQTAGKRIVELQPRLKKAIDSDPSVTKAAQEEKQTATALEKARTAATRVEDALMTAQANLDNRNQQLQAAILYSRRRYR